MGEGKEEGRIEMGSQYGAGLSNYGDVLALCMHVLLRVELVQLCNVAKYCRNGERTPCLFKKMAVHGFEVTLYV